MPVIKLGRRSVGGLERGVYYDSDLKGFGLRINASKTGTWFIEYRPGAGGRTIAKKRVTIGHLDRLSPEQAREAAAKALASVELGADPASAKAEERAALPFRKTVAEYIDKHVRTKRKERTAQYYDYILRLHIDPQIGSKRTNAITRADVSVMHGAIAKSSGKFVANRALAITSAVFNWLDPDAPNPARGIERFKEDGRERFLTNEEIAAIGEAMTEAETIGLPYRQGESKHSPKATTRRPPLPIHATNALRLLMLTGSRISEILNLEWSQVDMQRGLLFLPDSKTGRKTVVLSEAAIEVLRNTPRVGRFVIAGESAGEKDEKPRSDLKKPWAAICERANLDGVRLHDLRHTFASVGAGSGLGLPVIGKLLGHARAATTERYAHLATDASKRAADSIAGQIATALKGSTNG
ncbi:tyrosine-type recombinase/integrase [Pelagibacterium lentulum]|uniref:Integrase n=1 Tax=Pelagibacterium lentulum TaxID=2029865 RepID=A0A916R9E1_9HYPH|nr:site-specific integrase [Pelagibacterium lentulum]GGA47361.1 integrase [Pelagibacterium lentulum]